MSSIKHSLKSKLSFTIAIVVFITVTLISFLSYLFINEQFKSYITRQQQQKMSEIVTSLSQQYSKSTNAWNIDFIHIIGMSALYNGYIIEVNDIQNISIWDAQAHDMSLCAEVMKEISKRMQIKYPKMTGEFTSQTFHLNRDSVTIGSVNISYYGPYFFNENDFQFLNSIVSVLAAISMLSLIISIIIGLIMSKHLSKPILKTVNAAKQMSDGNYATRIDEKTDTKEIDMLILSINQLASSLEIQQKLRKQLTEDVSHELRTPIAIVQSHLEAIIEGVWQPTNERLESCNDEIKRIGILVKELEKLAKIDSDNIKLNKSNVNLLDIINKAAKAFEVDINNKSLQVNVNGICSNINADSDRISQVVVNLLSNAIKYTDIGGDISINIFENSAYVGFSIMDNGKGISTAELPFVFERFYRADKSRNRETGGLGIGLAIVKSIVEAHDGKVSVKSQINKGSCFEVLLPR